MGYIMLIFSLIWFWHLAQFISGEEMPRGVVVFALAMTTLSFLVMGLGRL